MEEARNKTVSFSKMEKAYAYSFSLVLGVENFSPSIIKRCRFLISRCCAYYRNMSMQESSSKTDGDDDKKRRAERMCLLSTIACTSWLVTLGDRSSSHIIFEASFAVLMTFVNGLSKKAFSWYFRQTEVTETDITAVNMFFYLHSVLVVVCLFSLIYPSDIDKATEALEGLNKSLERLNKSLVSTHLCSEFNLHSLYCDIPAKNHGTFFNSELSSFRRAGCASTDLAKTPQQHHAIILQSTFCKNLKAMSSWGGKSFILLESPGLTFWSKSRVLLDLADCKSLAASYWITISVMPVTSVTIKAFRLVRAVRMRKSWTLALTQAERAPQLVRGYFLINNPWRVISQAGSGLLLYPSSRKLAIQ